MLIFHVITRKMFNLFQRNLSMIVAFKNPSGFAAPPLTTTHFLPHYILTTSTGIVNQSSTCRSTLILWFPSSLDRVFHCPYEISLLEMLTLRLCKKIYGFHRMQAVLTMHFTQNLTKSSHSNAYSHIKVFVGSYSLLSLMVSLYYCDFSSNSKSPSLPIQIEGNGNYLLYQVLTFFRCSLTYMYVRITHTDEHSKQITAIQS